MKKLFLNGVILLMSILLGFLLGESVVSCLYPSSTKYYVWEPYTKNTFLPRPDIMPGIEGESRFFINSGGLRADEVSFKNTYKILTVGGSTTECLYLDQEEAWPYRLQTKLNELQQCHHVWVANAGKSGMNTRDHRVLFKWMVNRNPDFDMIIILAGVNDFMGGLYVDRDQDPEQLKPPLDRETALSRVFAQVSKYNNDIPAYKKTGLWRLYKKVRGVYRRMRAGGRAAVLDNVGQYYVDARKKRKRPYINELPSLEGSLKKYIINLKDLLEIGRKNSIRIVFLTQPFMWDAALPDHLEQLIWMGKAGPDGPYYATSVLASGMKIFNQALLDFCKEEGADCIDLAGSLPQDTSVLYDDVHFNEQGAEMVADKIAAGIYKTISRHCEIKKN